MTYFNITAVDTAITEKILHKIDNKTKPIGALGDLEGLALKIGMIQQSLTPQLTNPTILVFAADHGLAKENKVNTYPQEVTAQMVYNFLNGGAAINVFCKQNKLDLKIIDAGVNHDFGPLHGLIDAKIDYGTKNVLESPAMSIDQYHEAIAKGAELVESEFKKGCNIIGFGEMGIGNTSAAALLMAALTNTYIEECVGAGTGLNKEQIIEKGAILGKVLDTHFPYTLPDIMATFGGFEIAMIAGGILKASELKMTVLIDGFIVTSALLFANAMNENVMDYCIICHQSNEQGHVKMIDYLEKKTILNLGLRLGEGTGVALAYPLLEAAVNFLNEMASFESAGISKSK